MEDFGARVLAVFGEVSEEAGEHAGPVERVVDATLKIERCTSEALHVGSAVKRIRRWSKLRRANNSKGVNDSGLMLAITVQIRAPGETSKVIQYFNIKKNKMKMAHTGSRKCKK